MRVRAYGLSGCEIRFRFGKELTVTRLLREELAQMQRPVQPGDHDIAVQWRGRVNEADIEFGYNFRPLVTTLAELEREAPDVASVMKKNNVNGFVLCDAFVLSQPQGLACQVYGIFTVDRKALASGKPNAPVIKQDFLVHDMTASPPEITYYTGLHTPGPTRASRSSASASAHRTMAASSSMASGAVVIITTRWKSSIVSQASLRFARQSRLPSNRPEAKRLPPNCQGPGQDYEGTWTNTSTRHPR